MKQKIEENENITSSSKQIEILKRNFPSCFDKDGNFLPNKLAEIVKSNDINITNEGYSLNWLGKSYARLLANLNTETLISANEDHNKKPENAKSQNVLFQGDNLDVLKHLKNAYREQVKMIYIDPPYNTGSDGFVYEDDRKFTAEELSSLAGIDEDEAKRVLDFTQSKSNSHSAWLTFMYPRLYIAKELMRNDSVIFISIDDNEQAQLKMLCDEVFGEENYIRDIPVIKNLKGNNDEFAFAGAHENLLCYGKNKNLSLINEYPLGDEELEDWAEDDIGIFKKGAPLRATGEADKREDRPAMFYPILIKNGEISTITLDEHKKIYDTQEETFNDNYLDELIQKYNDRGYVAVLPRVDSNNFGRWRWGFSAKNIKRVKYDVISNEVKDGFSLYKKQRPEIGALPTKKPKSFFYKPEYSTGTGTAEVKGLFDEKIFKNPKPIEFIKDITILGSNDNDIILDFFAGSGTTAHAVMQLNAEEGDGKRKYITVQLDEPTDPKSQARKSGYKSVYDITRDRILKASEKIKKDYPEADIDYGFKEFKTIPAFDGYLDEADTPEQFTIFEGDKLSDEQRRQLLLTWQVDDELPLTLDLTPIEFSGYTAYQGEHILYFIHSGLNLDHIIKFLEKLDEDKDFTPKKIVIFEYILSSKSKREITEAIKGYLNKKQIELHLDIRY